MATARRKRRQSGQEILEFGLVAILFVPLLIGAVITGLGLVRSIQANHVCRDLDDIYIHGGDFSTFAMQSLAQRLATGLNLQIGSSFTGNHANNTGNGGDGLVYVSQIMWVGGTSSNSCLAVGGASTCTNHDSFVFTQRIKFGNSSVTGWSGSSLGDPSTTAVSATGAVLNPITDSGAKLPGTGQSNMQSLWQVSGGGRAPLSDGQVVYVVEYYTQPPNISLGTFTTGGIYARYFF
jgi:hypothetical protein